MSEPTLKLPNLVNADIAGLVADPGTFFFNTQIDALQYLDNLGNPIVAGNSGAIAQEIIVNATDGNDAVIGGPYATYEAARVYAKTIASPTYKVLIEIIGDQSITGAFTVSPYITILGNLSGTITATGNIELDADFLAKNNTTTYIQSCIIAAADFPAVWGAGDQNLIFFIGCELSGVPTFSNTSPNTNGFGNGVAFVGAANLSVQFFSSGVTLTDSLAAFIDVTFGGLPSVTATGSVSARILLQRSGGYGQVSLNAAGPGNSVAFMKGSDPTGVSLTSTFAQLITDVVSLANDSLNFSGGAVMSQVQFDTDLAPMKVSTSLYTPTNYSITSPDSRVGPNSPLSHLNGINLALGALPAAGASVNTVSIVTQINSTGATVVSSKCSRVGNVGTFSAKITFTATSGLPTIILGMPFTSGFTATGQASGNATVLKTPPLNAIGDGVVSIVDSVAGQGVQFSSILAASSGSHDMYVCGTYLIN